VPILLDSDLGDPPFISVKTNARVATNSTAQMRYDTIVAIFVTQTHQIGEYRGGDDEDGIGSLAALGLPVAKAVQQRHHLRPMNTMSRGSQL